MGHVNSQSQMQAEAGPSTSQQKVRQDTIAFITVAMSSCFFVTFCRVPQ